MSHFGLFTLSLILCSLNQAASEVYHITTNSTDLCTMRPCLTLSQFAANSSHYLHSNTTLAFLPGTHYLSNVNLSLLNVDNFVMKSENSTAQIKCTSNSHIQFSQSQYILITNLEFIGCGGNTVENVDEFVVQNAKFKGQENSGTALELTEVSAEIVNSTFLSNRKGSYRFFKVFLSDVIFQEKGFIGGVIIAISSVIDISQSKFEDNAATDHGGVLYSERSTIIIGTSEFRNNTATMGGVLHSYVSTIVIETSEFHDNNATSGVLLYSFLSSIAINESEFCNNTAMIYGGVLNSRGGTITIEASEFYDNSASYGGVMSCNFGSTVTIERNRFYNNSASYGGVIYCDLGSTVTIGRSGFYYNSAAVNGGVLDSTTSTITIIASEFHDNSAAWRGGILYSNSREINVGVSLISPSSHYIIIEESEFLHNKAIHGGVLYLLGSNNITIEANEFHNNYATMAGGVLFSESRNTITIGGCRLTKNDAPRGAVIYATYSSIQYHTYLLIENNSAERYAVIYLSFSEFRGKGSRYYAKISLISNSGSLVAFNSNITFTGYVLFVNNHPPQNASSDFQEGGAITLFQSNVFFDGVCNLEHNHAENGGAIHSTESKLYINGNVTIAHNTATGNGGGIYLSTSELNCQQRSTFLLFNNTAVHRGGGVHAISSTIRATSSALIDQDSMPNRLILYTGTRMNITKNTALMGGGISLEVNAKLDILKYTPILVSGNDTNTTIFTANSADYGGAVYVDDDTNSGTCASNSKTECFFQVLTIHSEESKDLKTQCIYFSQNYASISGPTLYGGLLDRCAVSQLAEVRNKHNSGAQDYEYEGSGISYFMDTATGEGTLISSLPVQVCLCTNIEHNCTLQSHLEIKKGEAFTLSVVAVDQIGHPVSATIQTSLHFTESGLAEGQLARKIPAECTNLTFNVLSPHNTENLTLYASDGPCNDAELSRRLIEIYFLPCTCPIGLQVSGINSTNCMCECHSDIHQYTEQCNSLTGSFVKQPQSRAWISYINGTGFLVYPNCPFDYCLSVSPPIDLNQPNGADAQCAFNRSSLLCGSCQSGLSLSLGSSRCLSCPRYWPALLIVISIAAIIAGIALVILLLVLNMVVTVGTLNGLIFYANIVYANRSILFPFQETNFITVFVSWLNLELGIDTCFSPGMETYMKMWIQLAFPTYVILLVVSVIIISSYYSRFSNLIGKKNPVATLATLILLSYATLLEICFKSLSVGILDYPSGSSEMLWLPDATIGYLSQKHIPLFIVAVLILLVGLIYTALLFSWQWLLYLPRWRIFKWSRNPKIQTFIETYHTPYTPKHRYWTGLLLIVRIILYLIAAVNVSNDPTVALTAISFTMCCILVLSKLSGSRVYRKWPVDILETFFYLNILSFAIFTWYSLGESSNQGTAAYTSVILTFIVLLLIILYHVYTYTPVFSKIKQTNPGRMIDKLLTNSDPKPKPERYWSPPPDHDIHRFNELLDIIDRPVNTNDYTVPLKQTPVNPTHSVVEVQQPQAEPQMAPPAADPEEGIKSQIKLSMSKSYIEQKVAAEESEV